MKKAKTNRLVSLLLIGLMLLSIVPHSPYTSYAMGDTFYHSSPEDPPLL